MIDMFYKMKDVPKYKNISEVDQNLSSAEPIDPDFSMYCQNKMSNGESILSDMRKRYPECIPQLDPQFVEKFFEYFNSEKPDFSELLNAFLVSNTQLLIQCGVMKLLFAKVPHSFHHIYLALLHGGKSAFDEFDQKSGFYIITSYSFDESFKLIISQILQLTIADNYDYSLFQPPFTSLFPLDSDINYPDLNCCNLVTNLLESNEKKVILSTLVALRIAFTAKMEARVFLGPVLMRYFYHYITDPDLATETVFTFSAGIDGIPQLDKNEIIHICESQIVDDNDFIVEIGIKLIFAVLDFQYQEIQKNMKGSILDIFENTQILPVLFQIAQNGSYKLKLTSLQLICALLTYCEPKNLRIFIENGLFQILSDTFEDEPVDSSAEIEIILVSIDILMHTLEKGISTQLKEGYFNQMLNYYKYLKGLQLNEDKQVSERAQQAYVRLLAYYGGFEKKEDI